MSKIITKDEFQKLVIESKDSVLVDFFANWCGPCRMLTPIMDEISNDVSVYKVDTDAEPELARDYGVMSIPCVIAFKDGKEVARSIGLKSKEEIMDLIK
jgi:thioredoxin 1